MTFWLALPLGFVNSLIAYPGGIPSYQEDKTYALHVRVTVSSLLGKKTDEIFLFPFTRFAGFKGEPTAENLPYRQ